VQFQHCHLAGISIQINYGYSSELPPTLVGGLKRK